MERHLQHPQGGLVVWGWSGGLEGWSGGLEGGLGGGLVVWGWSGGLEGGLGGGLVVWGWSGGLEGWSGGLGGGLVVWRAVWGVVWWSGEVYGLVVSTFDCRSTRRWRSGGRDKGCVWTATCPTSSASTTASSALA